MAVTAAMLFLLLAQDGHIKADPLTSQDGSATEGTAETSLTGSMAYMADGKKFLSDGLYLEAADLFETVLLDEEAKEYWPEAALLAGKAYLAAARAISSAELRREAIKFFENFEKSYSSSPLLEEDYYLWGLSLFEAEDYFEAEPKFNALLKRFPEGAFASESEYYLGRIMERAQKYLEAQKRYYKVIEYFRQPIDKVEDSTFRIARISELLDKHDLAIKWYELACQRNLYRCLMDADVLFYRGSAYASLGEHKQAVEQLFRFINIFPEDPRNDNAMLILAESLITLKDFKGAGAVLTSVMNSKNPNTRAEAMLRLAELQQESGVKLSDDDFITLYERIVEQAPHTDQAMVASLRLSRHYLNERAFANSLKYIDWFFLAFDQSKYMNEMLDLRDDAILGLLRTYLNEDEYFDGAMAFEERKNEIRKRSHLSQARFLAGRLYYGIMNYSRSAEELMATDEKFIDPDDRRLARLLLALDMQTDGKPENTMSELKSLSMGKIDEVSFAAMVRLIDLLLKQGKTEDALQYYSRLPEEYSIPRYLSCLDFRVGLRLSESGDFTRAKEAYDRYIQYNLEHREAIREALMGSHDDVANDSGSSLKLLDCASYLATSAFVEKAKCMLSLNETDDAALILKQIMDECDSSPLRSQSCHLLADLRSKQGKSDEALKILKECEKADSDDLYQEAQALLQTEIEVKRQLEDISNWWAE
ncbi:MAG: tetratricopeptide repeat protein [Candidatus Coatesbacteria bacterium]|nr:tetratricopeptide repeat protein [Candidatus Coatesbacteria bacterium]